MLQNIQIKLLFFYTLFITGCTKGATDRDDNYQYLKAKKEVKQIFTNQESLRICFQLAESNADSIDEYLSHFIPEFKGITDRSPYVNVIYKEMLKKLNHATFLSVLENIESLMPQEFNDRGITGVHEIAELKNYLKPLFELLKDSLNSVEANSEQSKTLNDLQKEEFITRCKLIIQNYLNINQFDSVMDFIRPQNPE